MIKLEVAHTGAARQLKPSAFSKEFNDIFNLVATAPSQNPISTFNWETLPSGRKYKYKGSCFVEKEEYLRILGLLKKAGLAEYKELIFPALALTFIKQFPFKYKKQDFAGLLKLHEQINTPGFNLYSIRLNMTVNNRVSGYTIEQPNLLHYLQQRLRDYLKADQSALKRQAIDQKEKTKRSYINQKRDRFLVDTFDSLQHLPLKDNQKFIMLGKLLVATGHLDGRARFDELVDTSTKSRTYATYNDYLRDSPRKFMERERKRSGTKAA